MKVINDYHCETCKKTTEEYKDTSIEEIDCACGGKSKKVAGGVSYFKIDGFRHDIMTSQWASRREKDYKRRQG